MTDLNERLPVNKWQLNQLAKKWLRAAKEGGNDTLPYLAQLNSLGFDRRLSVPGMGNRWRDDLEMAAARLLSLKLDPVKVTRYFCNNPNGDDVAVQTETLAALLEAAETWEEAAQAVMETFFDRISAENPHYQHPASHQD